MASPTSMEVLDHLATKKLERYRAALHAYELFHMLWKSGTTKAELEEAGEKATKLAQQAMK